MAVLSLLNGRLRVVSCGGALVTAESEDDPCCCECDCGPKQVDSWTQVADSDEGHKHVFAEDIVCSKDKYKIRCEKWEIVARVTRPAYPGYPRVVASGSIDPTGPPDYKRCLTGLPNPYTSHLGLKGYEIDYELWVMCADETFTGATNTLLASGGNWSSPSSWSFPDGSSAGRVPTADDTVYISGNMSGPGEAGTVIVGG